MILFKYINRFKFTSKIKCIYNVISLICKNIYKLKKFIIIFFHKVIKK